MYGIEESICDFSAPGELCPPFPPRYTIIYSMELEPSHT